MYLLSYRISTLHIFKYKFVLNFLPDDTNTHMYKSSWQNLHPQGLYRRTKIVWILFPKVYSIPGPSEPHFTY